MPLFIISLITSSTIFKSIFSCRTRRLAGAFWRLLSRVDPKGPAYPATAPPAMADVSSTVSSPSMPNTALTFSLPTKSAIPALSSRAPPSTFRNAVALYGSPLARVVGSTAVFFPDLVIQLRL